MAAPRVDVYLIAAGKWHDIDFARLELLKLLAEDERLRTRVADGYGNTEAIRRADMLITYTCDLVPDAAGLQALRDFLAGGGRWLALHGTNSVLRFTESGKVETPDSASDFMDLLGSQFAAHPPLQDFTVHVADPAHPLTEGLEDFETFDEIYLMDMRAPVHSLLETEWGGACPDFVRRDWPAASHPVMYLREHGAGAILYLTLGHCRGRYDMQPLIREYPRIERCSWENPVYYELLRRAIRWAMKADTERIAHR